MSVDHVRRVAVGIAGVAVLCSSCSLINPGGQLRKAVDKNDAERIRAILAANPDLVDQPDAAGSTPLSRAFSFGKQQAVLALLQGGADPNQSMDHGQTTPLDRACQNGWMDIVRWLVEEGHVDPNACNGLGYAPLVIACDMKHKEIVLYLLEHGADPNVSNKHGGRYPVSSALQMPDLLRALHEQGARLDVTDKDGNNLFHDAVTFETFADNELMEWLLAKGVNIHGRTINGHSTPLHLAADRNDVVAIAWLLDHGAELEARNVRGHTPLHRAAMSDAREAVKLLMARGANLSATDDGGQLPQDHALDPDLKAILAP